MKNVGRVPLDEGVQAPWDEKLLQDERPSWDVKLLRDGGPPWDVKMASERRGL